ncbi:hypothetical protein DZC71_05770 [Campylobacter hepaticus]|uniref:Uncharacterized protein n=1 Tax=Campylobacter hepaticus TaxID=1813019 RepID=A0A424YZQ0_9BACT|nr:hypothetical protein [Campylobacter hepaticus]MDX2331686.1 hypothetical protein [Campylobacter hepaticus]MDX2372261.1 hypothetical protein [Campylobacter hepaticus]MDX2397626.1 hypothetical protein [Campylobacter hepaticus]MDX5509458.1 hypothetical protein [Campylobacter hepaticus]QOW64193.1 hypothetical protein IRA69_02360 [Campylobacter hepaticus]
MKQWLNDFKLALIEENIDKLENLLDKLDLKQYVQDLAKSSQSKECLAINTKDIFIQLQSLLQEAIQLISQKKKSKAVEIQKFQKALTYFKP